MDRSRRILHGGWLDNAVSVFTRGWYGVSFDETAVTYGTVIGPLAIGSVLGPIEAGTVTGPLGAGVVISPIDTGRVIGPGESNGN